VKKKEKKGDRGRQLRDAAEEKLARTPGTTPAIKDRTLEEIVHELQVHQIELEMQNEELRRAQLASEESRSKYIDLYDFSPVGYFTFTPKALIAEVNLTGSALLGAQRQKLINGRFRRFVTPGDQDLWDQHIMSVLKNGEKQSCDLVLKRVDGTMFHARLDSIRMEGDGETPLVRTVISDITERKLAEKALQKTREMLVQSEKLAALGKLTTGASHEILNPLNILSLRLQVLEMTETISEKTKEALKIAKVQIDRIVKITKGISEFSRTTALYMTTVDLRELMEDVFLLTAPRLKAENVTFDFQHQADIPSLSLDKFRIEQVILNLVNNAIDAMKDGKEKLLRVTAALDSSEEKKNVRITFSDNGTGIKAEDMNRIFEPFFTTKEPDKGKGLGLSVCYGIIQDHHGRIWAENNEQGGATFIIEMPV